MCVVLPDRSTVAVGDECKEHYCTKCIDTHTCGTNVMMQLYCSRYLNNAYRFYWRSMRLCYPNPPFSQLAKVLTKIALKGAHAPHPQGSHKDITGLVRLYIDASKS